MIQPPRLNPPAFTLLELLVVMLIMSLSLGVFLGYNYRQRDAVLLRSAANDMQSFFRAARGHALLQGKDNICRYLEDEHKLTEDLGGKELKLPEIVFLAVDGEQDVQEAMIMAFFYADGSAWAHRIELSTTERKMYLNIDPVLGEIRIEQ